MKFDTYVLFIYLFARPTKCSARVVWMGVCVCVCIQFVLNNDEMAQKHLI